MTHINFGSKTLIQTNVARRGALILTLAVFLLGSHGQITLAAPVNDGPIVSTTTTVKTVAPKGGDEAVEEISADPDQPVRSVIKNIKVDITAYTSTVEECDDSPFITADGSHVRDGIIATNILPFGTKVRIPKYFGDRVFEVHDRMNTRYTYRFDIWMSDQKAMRTWGLKKNVDIEVIEMGNGAKHWAKAKTNDEVS